MLRPVHISAFISALAMTLAGLAVISSAPPANAIADRDCSDFASQKAAQIFFLKHGGPRRDPHRLDSEGDGVACESNPAPYYRKKKLPGGGGGGGGGNGGGGDRPKVIREAAIVTKVVDGDTVRVKLTKTRTRKDVRLIGIDTPEVYGGTECYGPEASSAMKRILPRNTRVTLTSDPTQDKKDRYGRLLRYITKKNGGLNVNRRQVFNGAARVYVYGNNPFKQVKSFRTAQSDAKRARRGLWGACR